MNSHQKVSVLSTETRKFSENYQVNAEERISRKEIELMIEVAAKRSSDTTLSQFAKVYGIEPEHFIFLKSEYDRKLKRNLWVNGTIVTTLIAAITISGFSLLKDFTKSWVKEIVTQEEVSKTDVVKKEKNI